MLYLLLPVIIAHNTMYSEETTYYASIGDEPERGYLEERHRKINMVKYFSKIDFKYDLTSLDQKENANLRKYTDTQMKKNAKNTPYTIKWDRIEGNLSICTIEMVYEHKTQVWLATLSLRAAHETERFHVSTSE